MELRAFYPTPEHQRAADAIVEFFATQFEVDAVVLVNSCARGKASRDSCLDINVLAQPAMLQVHRAEWQTRWEEFERTDLIVEQLRHAGQYSVVHLDIIDGVLAPEERDEAAGPDSFELSVGNFLAYSVPLWQSGEYFAQLQRTWLPYYPEALRCERLKMVRHYCLNNLHHIPLYLERGLYFQSFDRLYNAYREFLQAVFISHRVYPIAYNKWIREQIVEILNLPELYKRLPRLFEIKHFESPEIGEKASEVEQLLERYAPEPD
jgi:predicted nucleotidyltransferase